LQEDFFMPDLEGIIFFAEDTLLITFAFAEDFADLYESGDFMVAVFCWFKCKKLFFAKGF